MIIKRGNAKVLWPIFFFWMIGYTIASAQEINWKQRLEFCISSFRSGEYQRSADSLKVLLPTAANDNDSITVLKYLGFSYGMLSRISTSKEYFTAALIKHPAMEIDTLECPPQIAMIFQQAKLELAIAKKDADFPEKPPVELKNSVPILPIFLLAAAMTSAGAAGYYYYSGTVLRGKYQSLATPDQRLLDHYFSGYRNSFVKSAVFGSISGIFLPVSIYLLLKKPAPSASISISGGPGTAAIAISF